MQWLTAVLQLPPNRLLRAQQRLETAVALQAALATVACCGIQILYSLAAVVCYCIQILSSPRHSEAATGTSSTGRGSYCCLTDCKPSDVEPGIECTLLPKQSQATFTIIPVEWHCLLLSC